MTDRVVVTTPIADANIRAIDGWWRANRPAAPDLFVSELTLAGFPRSIGKRYRQGGLPTLRRYLLRATRYHVYYVETGPHELTILAVWGAIRGRTPDFKQLR